MEAIVFFVSAAIVLVGALGVIVMRNPVHAALSLVMTLFGVAVLFINLEAYFLAAVQVIVYAGAIVVLFLFVIMLVGVDKAERIRKEPIVGQRELALLAGAGLIALALIIGLATAGEVTGEATGDLAIGRATEVDVDGDGDTEIVPPEQPDINQLGEALFTDYVFAFEITGLLLTVAVVGAVVLARRPKGELQPLPEVDPPAVLRIEPEPDEDPDVDDEVSEHDDASAADDEDDEAEADAADEDDAEEVGA